MNMNFVIITIFALIVSGCQTFVPIYSLEKTGVDVMIRASKLPVISSSEIGSKILIKPVAGYSCMNQATEPSASQAGAADQVKIAAVLEGATAIADLKCEEGGVSLLKNCWHSWSCTANAYK